MGKASPKDFFTETSSENKALVRRTCKAFKSPRQYQRILHEYGHVIRDHQRDLAYDNASELVVDHQRCKEKLHDLAVCASGVLEVPSRTDRRFTGWPCSFSANPPSPYVWAPVLWKYGHGLTCELSAGTMASSSWAGEVLDKPVVHVRLQPPLHEDESYASFRRMHSLASNEEQFFGNKRLPLKLPRPKLVLLALPLPCDRWSIGQCVNYLKSYTSNDIDLPLWGGFVHKPLDFTESRDDYEAALLERLRYVDRCLYTNKMQEVAHVAILIPGELGLRSLVKNLVKSNFRHWVRIDSWVVLENNKTHLHDGSALLLEELIVWSVRFVEGCNA